MPYLIIVTLLWALSFNFIGAFLANQVDSYFSVLTRVVLALAVFLLMKRFRAVPRAFMWGVALCGVLLFGVTYFGMFLIFILFTFSFVLLLYLLIYIIIFMR